MFHYCMLGVPPTQSPTPKTRSSRVDLLCELQDLQPPVVGAVELQLLRLGALHLEHLAGGSSTGAPLRAGTSRTGTTRELAQVLKKRTTC